MSGTRLALLHWMSMRIFRLSVLLATVAASAQAAESPLVISDIVTGESSHVKITNTGHQPGTAWSLAATIESAGGRTPRRGDTTPGCLRGGTPRPPTAAPPPERRSSR